MLIRVITLVLVLNSAIVFATIFPSTFPPGFENGIVETKIKFYDDESTDSPFQPIAPRDEDDYILPATVRPSRYDLRIKTEIDQGIFEFSGEVSIEVEAIANTNTIVLHSKLLTITEQTLTGVNGDIELDDYLEMDDEEFLVIRTKDTILETGEKYTLTLAYTGVLGTSNFGFFRGNNPREGRNVYIASTKFESQYARYGFPCFDEPALKATFKLTIEHGCDGYHAVSNMPAIGTVTVGDMCVTEFEETIRMSTYLLAFAISDYVYVENYEGDYRPDQIKHRVYRPTNLYSTADTLPLEAGEAFLSYFEEYFGIPYALPKMDQIGISNAGGAMENWGLVTYLPTMLFFDESSIPRVNIFGRISTIAHEFVHQWFGNLVTPEEWGYLWLSEGFANFYGEYLVDHVYSDMRYMDQRMVSTCLSMKVNDARSTARPMTRHIWDPKRQREMFDNTSYSKAGCILYMILHALTEDRFKKALTRYLNSRAFQETQPDYLSAAFDAVARENPSLVPDDVNFKTIFDTWHTQEGLPIMQVDYDIETGDINLSQKRYTTEPIENIDSYLWSIPYNFISASEASLPEFQYTHVDGWLQTRSETLRPTASRDWTGEEWVLFNKQQTGYYRVNYNTENWKKLITALKTTNAGNIPPQSRILLIDDAFEFAAEEIIDLDIPLELLTYLPIAEDVDPFVWVKALGRLYPYDTLIRGSDIHPKFLVYLQSIMTKAYEKTGIVEAADEPIYIYYLRTNLAEWACRSYVEKCLVDAAAALKDHINDVTVLPTHIFNTVRLHGLVRSDSETFFKLWQMVTNANRAQIFAAMAKTADENLLNLFLVSTITANGEEIGEIVVNWTENDRSLIIESIISNNLNGVEIVIDFLSEAASQTAAVQLFKAQLDEIMDTMARYVKSAGRVEKFTTFLELYAQHGISPDDYWTIVDNNYVGLNITGPIIDKWLEDNNYVPDGSQTVFVSTILLAASIYLTLTQSFN